MLAFLNEVAGGRKLLEALRERVDAGADAVAVAAPQNQPIVGQIVDRDEVRDAAQSRVEVTQSVLAEFGIEASGAVMDPESWLALDDAVRAFAPGEVLISCLYESRFGIMRRDLVEWAKQRFEVPVTHIPVRVDDDAIRWDVTHTLVVGTQTIASPDLVARLKGRAAETPHRYTIICPRSGDLSREEVCDAAREHARRALSLGHRRHRPADEPGAVRRDRERDRALPDRRDPRLDPRRPAVEVARGGADRAGRGDHRQAGRARRGWRGRRAAGAERRAGGGAGLMESASVAVGQPEPHEHHGPPEAHQSSRIDRQTLGILIFIVSEIMLFGAFFASYFFLRVVANDGPWPPEGFELPVAIAGVNTAILVSSSLTMHWGLEGARKGNRLGMRMGLMTTWLLGATFLFIQINEYIHIGFSARDGAFGSIFYGLTGLHGAHVFVGLLPAHLRQRPRLARPLRPRGQGPPRGRDTGDLLALRRRDVDHRLHDRLHPLETAYPSGAQSRCASGAPVGAPVSTPPAPRAASSARLFSAVRWASSSPAASASEPGIRCP